MRTPRYRSVILGAWLFISAFLWAHTPAQETNTWISGLLFIAFALWAVAVPAVRYLNTVLAVWLFVSAWTLPTISAATVWNNVVVAVVLFVLSLLPTEEIERRKPTPGVDVSGPRRRATDAPARYDGPPTTH